MGHLDTGDETCWLVTDVGDQEMVFGDREEALRRLDLRRRIEERGGTEYGGVIARLKSLEAGRFLLVVAISGHRPSE
jgi:hypothetical protein